MKEFDSTSVPALKQKLDELTKTRGRVRSKITKACNEIDK